MVDPTTDPAGSRKEPADEAISEAAERPTFNVKTPAGGWAYPWPNVAEVARVLPTDRWTLIGGLMTQLHAIHRGINAVRPTNDVDIALHIETARGIPNTTADALESLGYEIKKNIDPRNNVGHRFTRGDTHVDVVSSDAVEEDVVDVVVADHPAPIGICKAPLSFWPASTTLLPRSTSSSAQTANAWVSSGVSSSTTTTHGC